MNNSEYKGVGLRRYFLYTVKVNLKQNINVTRWGLQAALLQNWEKKNSSNNDTYKDLHVPAAMLQRICQCIFLVFVTV